MIKRAKYILLGFVLCLCMGIGSKLAVATVRRIKSETKRTGLTLKQQVAKNTADIKQLKKEK